MIMVEQLLIFEEQLLDSLLICDFCLFREANGEIDTPHRKLIICARCSNEMEVEMANNPVKKVVVNKQAKIIKGASSGFKGKVVGFDSSNDEVEIRITDYACIIVSSWDIEQ